MTTGFLVCDWLGNSTRSRKHAIEPLRKVKRSTSAPVNGGAGGFTYSPAPVVDTGDPGAAPAGLDVVVPSAHWYPSAPGTFGLMRLSMTG